MKFVHVTVGAGGAVASIIIALLYHNDHAPHTAGKVNVALFVATSFIVHPFNTNALVLVYSKSASVSHATTVYVKCNVLLPFPLTYPHVLAGEVLKLIAGVHVTFTSSLNVTVISIFDHHEYDPFAVVDVTLVTVGDVVSILKLLAVLNALVFHNLSNALTLQ